MYQLISFDMDGTLLDSSKRIRQDSIEAIGRASANGKVVILSTGRCMPELRDYRDDLSKISCIIGTSGAFIYDNTRQIVLHETVLPAQMSVTMMKRVQTFEKEEDTDTAIQILYKKAFMQRDKVARIADYQLASFRETYERTMTKPEDLYGFFLGSPFPLYKFNVFCRSKEDRAKLRSRLADLPLTMVDTEDTALECSPAGVSKASAMIRLCGALGIPLSRTICVGDGYNDIEQLKAAGLAIAMGNSVPEVIQLAGAVVSDNDHGGCAQAINEYLLSQSCI